jgi:uncharacterized membrane protein
MEGKQLAETFVGLTVGIVIAVSLVPTIYTTINGTNTTAWSNIVGGTGAAAIFQLIVLIFVAGIVIYVLKEILM